MNDPRPATNLKALLEAWLQNQPAARESLKYMFLWSHWPEIVGDTLAQTTAPYKVEGNTLHVYVKDGATAQSVVYAQPFIDQKVKAICPDGSIEKVRTRMWTGPTPLENLLAYAETIKKQPLPSFAELLQKLSTEQQSFILTHLRQIKDRDLKEALLQTWVRSLFLKEASASETMKSNPAE